MTITTIEQFIHVHQLMWGEPGRFCAEFLAEWAPKLFAEPIDPRTLRIAMAPVELGPYNRHAGYTAPSNGLILANRHLCAFGEGGDIVLLKDARWVRDFLVHELCHHRQAILLECSGIRVDQTRGAHRDTGWYGAIAEASPRYLGVEFQPEIWPGRKSVRIKVEGYKHGKIVKVLEPGRMSEADATHWPHSVRPGTETIGRTCCS